MPVNWKEPEAFTRLLAAMVAAQDLKLDYRKIATMYGNGATYDSIEGRFRIIKKEASAMKAEIDSGQRPEAPARGAISNIIMPKKSKSAVFTPKKNKTISGRVGKVNGTPSKKRSNVLKGVKEEPDSSSSSFAEAQSTEEDELLADDGKGGQVDVERGGSSIYYDNEYDFDEDGMDVGAF